MVGRVSLTLVEARARAALISDVSYALELDLTGAAEQQTFGVRAEVTFSCTEPGAETFLELTHASELLVDGVAAEYDGQRIRLHRPAASGRRSSSRRGCPT